MTITINLKKLRGEHPEKPTQRKIADLIGITETNYRRLENGYVESMNLATLDILCKYFNCTPNDILMFKTE